MRLQGDSPRGGERLAHDSRAMNPSSAQQHSRYSQAEPSLTCRSHCTRERRGR
ncbi:hypothetical protein C8Q80DRAFT_368554 [Daedaleopsis nitida]|nr:hypothetical protein C8Q80DRAFT_368554 [Daedaleopsis nitida]